jgi:hypothetical protein
VFDEDGNLINGQHRLLALTVTGKGSWLYTMKNVPRDALALIDNGKPRSVADALTFNGNNKKATLLGSVIRHYILVQTGRLYRNSSEHKVSNAEVVDLVNAHPEFEVACDLGNRIAAKVGCGATGLAVAWLLIRQANPGASHVVDQFFDKLETRANEPIGSAIHALANRLHKAENDKTNRNSTRPVFGPRKSSTPSSAAGTPGSMESRVRRSRPGPAVGARSACQPSRPTTSHLSSSSRSHACPCPSRPPVSSSTRPAATPASRCS